MCEKNLQVAAVYSDAWFKKNLLTMDDSQGYDDCRAREKFKVAGSD